MTRGRLMACALATLLLALPASAHGAKLKVATQSAAVSSEGRVKIKVANPNRKAAKGTLRLTGNPGTVASVRFRIPARRSRNVKLGLTVAGYNELQARGSMRVRAIAKARGIGTTRRSVTLKAPASQGGDTGGNDRDGRYQGTYAENNVDLAFNVVGSRLFTGPFDAFYLDAKCRNVDPEYTGPNQEYSDATAIEPVEAAIASDGSFRGQGTYHSGNTPPINWEITGRIDGRNIPEGQFSATYTDGYGNPCSGVTRFTAQWYGDYTF